MTRRIDAAAPPHYDSYVTGGYGDPEGNAALVLLRTNNVLENYNNGFYIYPDQRYTLNGIGEATGGESMCFANPGILNDDWNIPPPGFVILGQRLPRKIYGVPYVYLSCGSSFAKYITGNIPYIVKTDLNGDSQCESFYDNVFDYSLFCDKRAERNPNPTTAANDCPAPNEFWFQCNQRLSPIDTGLEYWLMEFCTENSCW